MHLKTTHICTFADRIACSQRSLLIRSVYAIKWAGRHCSFLWPFVATTDRQTDGRTDGHSDSQPLNPEKVTRIRRKKNSLPANEKNERQRLMAKTNHTSKSKMAKTGCLNSMGDLFVPLRLQFAFCFGIFVQ